jgi:hypothetical protein
MMRRPAIWMILNDRGRTKTAMRRRVGINVLLLDALGGC